MSAKTPASATLKFNVSGQVYEVPRDVLSAHPNSLLSKLAEDADATDAAPIFVEADPDLFRYVLQFYQHGKIEIPPTVAQQALLHELQKLGLEGFEGCLRSEAGSLAVALELVQDLRQLISKTKETHLEHIVAAEVMQVAVTKALRSGGLNFTVDPCLLREQAVWRVVDKHRVLIIVEGMAREHGFDVVFDDESAFKFSRRPADQHSARSEVSEGPEVDEAGTPLGAVGGLEPAAAAGSADTVKFRVGDRTFEVSREPTLSLHPCSKLSILAEQADASDSGEITVDADPDLFRYILQYHRDRKVFVPCNVPIFALLAMAKEMGLDLDAQEIQRESICRPMFTATAIASASIRASTSMARKHREFYIGLVVVELALDAIAQARTRFVVSERDVIWADPYASLWKLTPAAYERVVMWSRKNGLDVEIKRHFWRTLMPSGGYAWRSNIVSHMLQLKFRERPRAVLFSAWKISFRVVCACVYRAPM